MTLREEAINDIKAALHDIRMKVHHNWANIVTILNTTREKARKDVGGGGEGQAALNALYGGVSRENAFRYAMLSQLDIIETITVSLLKE